MQRFTEKIKKALPSSREDVIYGFFLLSLWALTLEEPIASYGFSGISIFRNLLAVPGVLLFIYEATDSPERRRELLLSPALILGILFSVCGLMGYFLQHFQNLSVTLQALYSHVRFFICLWFFTELFLRLPLEKYARKLFRHAAFISALLIILTILDFLFEIWPRQTHRYGIGSIQLMFGHPSNLGAHTVFFVAFLCVLQPYLRTADGKRSVLNRINAVLTFGLLGVLLLTLRLRLFGFVIFFLILYVYMILIGGRLSFPSVLLAVGGALAVGWKRLYGYYFSPYAASMARGQLAINGVRIANEYFPFGTGFGTFGSRMAQINYSPLYFKYGMMTTLGLSPEHPNYACDAFVPMLLGETGWLGTAAYLGILLLLLAQLFRLQKRSPKGIGRSYAVFTALLLLAYEVLEATGTLAFSEIYSVLVAIPYACALAQLKKAQA